MSTKDEILKLLESVKRDGMGDLINWLESSDYFTAPSSTKYHGNYPGGLADHSLNVYDSLVLLNEEFSENKIAQDSIIIVALLHDLCKTGYYVEDEESATPAQVKLLNDLIDEAALEAIPKRYQTKAYVSKVIDHLKNKREGELPKFVKTYKVEDTFPIGHGEKSLSLVQRYMQLKPEEALAIRWHLGGYDPGFHFFFPSGAPVQQAIREYPLVALLISADFLATWMVDQTH